MKKMIFTCALFIFTTGLHLHAQTGKTLYIQDFSSGVIPSGWSATSETANPFSWSFSNPLGRTTGFPTSNNGFAIADRAYFGNVNLKAVLSSKAWDFTSSTKVFLEFYQQLEGLAAGDTAELLVSNDNGAHWIRHELMTASTSGTEKKNLDISTLAAGHGQVKLRFRFVSNHDAYWAFDDLRFYTWYDNDLAITSISAPVSGCTLGAAEPVTIRVKNYGLQTVSTFNAGYKADAQADVYETATLSLDPGEEKDFTFTTPLDLSAAGKHILNANVSLPEDSDQLNNQIVNHTVYSLHYDVSSAPYSTGFEGVSEPSFPLYTSLDGDGDGSSWLPTTSAGQGHNGSYLFLSTQMRQGTSDWLFSHCFVLQAGDVYTISFYTKMEGYSPADQLILYIGESPQPASMLQKVLEVPLGGTDNWKLSSISFKVPASGTWFLGWQALRNTDVNSWLGLDDVSLSKAATNDLGVVSMNLSSSDCYPDSVPLQVGIYNYGSAVQSDFYVSCRINSSSYSTVQIPVALASMDTLWYTFPTPVPLLPGSNTTLEVYTLLTGDENAANDKNTQTVINKSVDVVHTSFYYGFESNENPDAISLLNGNQDYYELWVQSTPVISGKASLVYNSFVPAQADEWFVINQCLYLKKGIAYRFGYLYRSSASNYSLDFFLGNAPDTLALTKMIKHQPLGRIIGSGSINTSFTFGVPEDGIYYLGGRLNGYDANTFVLDYLNLSFGYDNDLGPVELISPEASCYPSDTVYVTGAYVNFGNVPVSNFSVGYNSGGTMMEKVLISEPLAPMDTLVHTFSVPLELNFNSETAIELFTEFASDPYYENDYLGATAEQLKFDLMNGSYVTEFGSYETRYFSVIDGNQDGNTWGSVQSYNGILFESSGMPADETLVSRCLELKAGQLYTLKIRPEISNIVPSLSILIGQDANVPGMSLIYEFKNLQQEYSPDGYENMEYTVFFTVPADGIYHIGLRTFSDGSADYSLNPRYLQIYKAPRQDIAAISVVTPVTACSLGNAEAVTVKLANLGTDPLPNPGLSICLDPDPDGNACKQSLDGVYEGTILSLDTVSFTFNGTLDLSAPGYHQLDFRVNLEGDEDYGNNYVNSQLRSGINFMQEGFTGQFYSEAYRNEWTVVDDDENNRHWDFVNGNMQGWNAVCPAETGNSNDWLFSRCLNLLEGDYYRIQFYAWSDSGTGSLALHIGTAPDPASMDKLLADIHPLSKYNQETQEPNTYTAYFKCTVPGLYYLGFVAGSAAQPDSVHLGWIGMHGEKGQDIASSSLISPVTGCEMTEQQAVRVSFASYGIDTLRQVPVYYSLNNGIPVKDTLVLLLPFDQQEFEFTSTFSLGSAGNAFHLKVWADQPGDDDRANDTLVSPEIFNFSGDTLSWNYSMGFEEGEPMRNYYQGFGATTQAVCSQGMIPPLTGDCVMAIGNLYSSLLDAGLATHCFRLSGGRVYNLSFASRLIFADEGVNQSVYLATAPDLESVIDTLSENILATDAYEQINISIQPAGTGTYYLIWYFQGNFTSINGVMLDDISLHMLDAGVPQTMGRGNMLSIYPNPAADHLYVQVPAEAGSGAYGEIINLLGEKVFSMEQLVAGERVRFDFTSLPRGSYLIRIQGKQAAWQQKFIIR
jgi:hypothetical protein